VERVHRGTSICPICNRHLRGDESLLYAQHLLECKERNSHKRICNICDGKFGCPAEVRKHKERRHSLFDRSTACSECGKVLSCPSAVKAHKRRVHQPGRSITRTICGQNLASLICLQSHTKLVHQGLRKCLQCYQYIEVAEYKQHLLDCRNQYSGRVSTCPDCGKTYANPGYCKRHYEMVHQSITFKCRECGKFFPKSELEP
jgi:hypothetical protein